MKLVDLLAAAARGEPLALTAILVAVVGEFGATMTEGDADTVVRLVALAAAYFLTRRHTTPADNPEIPANPKPVITLTGKREA